MTRRALVVGKSWEKTVVFSLGVVCSGTMLHTAGITARDANGRVVGKGDMRAQVDQCYANLGDVLAVAGASWADVVKYTIYTTDIDLFDKATRDMRSRYFVDRPASTLVEVRRLIHPDMLVEIEAVVSLA